MTVQDHQIEIITQFLQKGQGAILPVPKLEIISEQVIAEWMYETKACLLLLGYDCDVKYTPTLFGPYDRIDIRLKPEETNPFD